MPAEAPTTLLRGGLLQAAAQGDRASDSLLIVGDRIGWVGAHQDAPAADRIVDLAGSRVVPGLTDAHLHFFMRAQELVNLQLGTAGSLPDLLDRVQRGCAAATRDEWIISSDYSEQSLAERRHPTLDELDAVAQGRPVLLRRTGGHLTVANSAALERAGIDANTPDPPGGTIERKNGRLTGVLTELAADELAAKAPPPSPARMIRAIGDVIRESLGFGIVAAVEAAVGFNSGFETEWNIWSAIRDAGLPPLRLGFMLRIDPAQARDLGIAPTGLDPWWQVRTLKFFVDGIIGARTAAFSEPYVDRDTCGLLIEESTELRAKAIEAHAAGWQLAAHVIGDRAIDQWLSALEAAQKADPRPDPRHRLEHFAVRGEDALRRVRALGAIVVPQYGFLPRLGASFAQAIGPDRTSNLYPGRSALQADVSIAGSSDHPIGPLSPFIGIAAAVDRLTSTGLTINASEALTRPEALSLYTRGGAVAMGHETWRGSISAGQAADIAVLDRDILLESSDIARTTSRATWVGGKLVHSDGTLNPLPIDT
ncbi:amidohydrolase [Bradyrhizobium sp.]|uniref:amidohydrolase n=1 Tax=Bradyrhizobium sp. TaxID=376 RepID=UPI0039E36EFC